MTSPATTARPPLVWINGTAAPSQGPHVSVFDAGFGFADGVFETLRVYGGTAFRLERHLERLVRALEAVRIAVPGDLDALAREAIGAAAAAGFHDASMRITVTRGVTVPGPKMIDDPPPVPTVAVFVGALPLLPDWLYTEGITAQIARARRNERAPTAGIKTLSYTDSAVALREARAAGFDDAILLDMEGHVSEGAVCNVFICKHGALATPPSSCGVLCGITREAVLEIARALGIPAYERPLSPEELFAADEAFTTQTLREIIPLVSVDGRTIGDGSPGSVTKRVMKEFATLVQDECIGALTAAG